MENRIRQRRRATLEMLVCAAMWSIAGIFIKQLPWHPLLIGGLRAFIGGLVILAYCRLRGVPLALDRQSLSGGVALCLTMTCFVAANKLTTAANAIVLQFTAPIFLMLFSVRLLGRRFSRQDVLAVALTLGGVSLFFFDQLTPGRFWGNLVALGAGLCFGRYYMSLDGATESQRMSAILTADALSALLGLPFLFLSPPEVSARAVSCILILGVVQLGLPYILLARAAAHCPPLACCLLGAVEPILNPLWVFLFDGEAPGPFALAGGAAVIAAVTVWSVYDSRRAARRAEEESAGCPMDQTS